MARSIAILDPVSRVEGHLRVTTRFSGARVQEAMVHGTMYRGFENILQGRGADDARMVCQRICGVCPSSHGIAAAIAAEAVAGISLTRNGHILRNLFLGSGYLYSHILHFYQLNLPDYTTMPQASPWGPSYGGDRRLSGDEQAMLIQHYGDAFGPLHSAHKIATIVGGKTPHANGIATGGMTARPTAADLEEIETLLGEIEGFIHGSLLPDMGLVAQHYPEYAEIGTGPGAFLSVPAFYEAGLGRHWIRGGFRKVLPAPQPAASALQTNQITESVQCAWYEGSGLPEQPRYESTEPNPDKEGAYSWIKAPRYGGTVCEVGPFARMAVAGLVHGNSSVLGRITARGIEASWMAKRMQTWISNYRAAEPALTDNVAVDSGFALGLTEAPRGSLIHFVEMRDGLVHRYQVLTPTCWNCSPRDETGQPGALEHAIAGTRVANKDEPIEVLRIVHSFDPCMACSVH